MKATHKLTNIYAEEWLLACLGSEHYWCKTKGPYANNTWEGPAGGSVEGTLGKGANWKITKLNTFKGNK